MIFNIVNPDFPVVAAAIHDGHTIRPELHDYLFIKDKDRLREEDPFTGRWLKISENTITTKDSRFEVDLNRPKEKSVYMLPEDSWGLKVWKYPLPSEVYEQSLKKYYDFYNTLEKEIDKLLIVHNKIVIYDMHSYNYKRNGPKQPPEDDSANPELNLGTGTLSRDRWAPIIDKFIYDTRNYNFMGRNMDVRENIKFRGGYFARWIHHKYPDKVCCLSIEFRKFFMDEWTGEPFEDVIDEITKMLKFSLGSVLEELNKIKHE